MADIIIKQLKFPGSDQTYAINASKFAGHDWSEIDAIEEQLNTIASFDAMRYVGTIAASTTSPGAFTPAANKGDVFKVTSAGYVMGAKVDAGDMLICNTDGTGAATSTNYITVGENWDIIQSNIDADAILDHTHNITLNKSSKELTHTVTPTKSTLTAQFKNGAASVTGTHGHTAEGSVTITPAGSVSDTSVTPKGTVKLTAPTSAGTNDVTLTPSGTVANSTEKFVTGVTVSSHGAHKHTGTTGSSGADVTGTITISTETGTANYTPEGTIGNSNACVTAVNPGSNSISAHEASSGSAGGHTPEGTVSVVAETAGGSVASHKHNARVSSAPTASFFNGVTYSGSGNDGVLTFTAGNAVTSVTVTDDNVAPTFTGTAHNHTATFKGTSVAGHTHTITVEDHDSIVPSFDVVTGNHTHSFTGEGVQLVASHNLDAAGHTHTFTTSEVTLDHTVTAPTAAHDHDFTGNNMYVHAAFTGTAESHKHTFTGTSATHDVDVTVNDYTGTFTGTASGTVTPSVSEVVTGVAVGSHNIDTVDTATSGKGNQ